MTAEDLVARLMARFEPFETSPVLAVGVSGGADSLAFAFLADRWARARNGRVLALTVDHGLRPGSDTETGQVGAWLGARGISHSILPWQGDKPKAGIQAAAREARSNLLGARCREEGILHLLLAHHRGDQAETVALRREDKSGPDGLAAIAAETPTPWGRILRPMLGEPKATLTGYLASIGHPWIEDPTNRDERHARVRLRRRIAADGSEAVLALDARASGIVRVARERRVAEALVRHARLAEAGWALISPLLLSEPADIAGTVFARAIVAIGNLDYAPRGERLQRLLSHLRDERAHARTLGGCRLLSRQGRWLIVREPASLPRVVPFAGRSAAWDRFVVSIEGNALDRDLTLGALGTDLPPAGAGHIPSAARPSLPAIRDLDGVVAVPHFGWVRPGADEWLKGATSWTFPRQGLARAEFAVA